MSVKSLALLNFTAFANAAFEFSPGITVLVGENGTGKTHVLKALYVLAREINYARSRAAQGGPQRPKLHLAGSFAEVFGVAPFETNKLIRARADSAQLYAQLSDSRALFSINIDRENVEGLGLLVDAPRAVFLPAREILSVFPGFAETNRNRELAFDATYVDLADALDLPPLKGPALEKAQPLIDRAEDALGGREEQKGGKFFVTAGRDRFEAQLVAEGLRKVAQVARLLRNGRIAPGTLLLWDEPEANLNPVLLRKVTDLLIALAQAGVQVVLATHDYLLSQTLSLHAEHPTANTPPMRFFGLSRVKRGPVTVTTAPTIAGIADNPILREHARQYDLELKAFEAGE